MKSASCPRDAEQWLQEGDFEVEAVQKAGGKVVRLTRQIYEDSHSSETALDEDKYDWKNFDAVVDNSGMGIKETNNSIQKLISDWGW